MDRRRFIPSSLGLGPELEERMLLSTAGTKMVATAATNRPASRGIEQNLAQRLQRIENLPYILRSFEPGRAMPPSVIGPIQDDLTALIGTIGSPTKSVLSGFNRTIRSVKAAKTISPVAAQSLVNAFDAVLRDAGANEALRSKFSADMTALAKLDSAGTEPIIQAINDFGTITQLAIAVGQPFHAPAKPSLAAPDRVNRQPVTRNRLPTFVGHGSPDSIIQITDATTGRIVAAGTVPHNGTYSITATTPLADGTYAIRAQTLEGQYVSLYSQAYKFRVVSSAAAVPRGPRG